MYGKYYNKLGIHTLTNKYIQLRKIKRKSFKREENAYASGCVFACDPQQVHRKIVLDNLA